MLDDQTCPFSTHVPFWCLSCLVISTPVSVQSLPTALAQAPRCMTLHLWQQPFIPLALFSTSRAHLLLHEVPVFCIIPLITCIIKIAFFCNIVVLVVQSLIERLCWTDPVITAWELLWWPPASPPAPVLPLVNFFIFLPLLQLILNSCVNKSLHSRWQTQYFF